MLNQLSLWQMMVDLGLITAILVMALRWMKGSRAQALLPQTLELEASLRNLIDEAEASGRQLNDQLLRRESNIQKYLTELEESERRITRSVIEGEEVSKRLEVAASAAQRNATQRNAAQSNATQSNTAQQERGDSYKARAYAVELDDAEAPAPQARAPQARTTRSAAEAPAATTQQAPRRSAPVQSSAAVQHSSYSNAPKIISRPPSAAGNTTQAYQKAAQPSSSELQQIYALAEQMLKQGAEFEQVAQRTKLPLDGVKMLSQMIEIERDEESTQELQAGQVIAGDPRLGALGTTRRQTNVR
ncbi:MAG: hypothetical protein NTV65_05115 [Proteobacteria bacterium]|nr:hypothetical protein [Pseudomonadota bacterium]